MTQTQIERTGRAGESPSPGKSQPSQGCSPEINKLCLANIAIRSTSEIASSSQATAFIQAPREQSIAQIDHFALLSSTSKAGSAKEKSNGSILRIADEASSPALDTGLCAVHPQTSAFFNNS